MRLGLAGGALLALYGGLLVAVGAVVLAGVGDPPSDPDALRWHVLFWDLWFLVWGVAWFRAARGAVRAPSGERVGRADGRPRRPAGTPAPRMPRRSPRRPASAAPNAAAPAARRQGVPGLRGHRATSCAASAAADGAPRYASARRGMPAGIVLAGGRSSRMGTPKAWLDWHGSTLLRRTCGVVARGAGGPVVVVRAPGQELPRLPAGVRVVEDAREGKGPLQGLLAGLEAVDGDVAFAASTDMPFLHPRFVAAVCAAARDADAAVPHLGGFRQPLAAAYRTALAPLVAELVADGPDEARVPVRALRHALARRPRPTRRASATSTRARTTRRRAPSPRRPSTCAASARCAGRPPTSAPRRSARRPRRSASRSTRTSSPP